LEPYKALDGEEVQYTEKAYDRHSGLERNFNKRLSGRNHFFSIQILRGMAALAVVFFHVSEMLLQYTDRQGIFCRFASMWHTGVAGVDLFFIISGFVMVQSTRGKFQQSGSSAEFMLRRIIRIVPSYWLYTSVMLVLVLLPFTLKNQVFSGLYTIASYLLIPVLNPVSSLDLPLLAPGWTLSYEMYFYLIFALLLRFHERFLLPAVSLLFFISASIGVWLGTQNPIVKVLTSPLLLEFVLGCYLARLVDTRTPSNVFCYVMIACGLVALWCSQDLHNNVELRFIVWGIPMCILTAGCVFLEKNGKAAFIGRHLLTALGDCSYSTYLTHTFIILCASTLLKRRIVLDSVPNDLLVIGSVSLCLLAGYLSYIFFERNFSRKLLGITQRQTYRVP
jgi:exopolysaccharide production protein ExoZ